MISEETVKVTVGTAAEDKPRGLVWTGATCPWIHLLSIT
ncbi:hypothetical protein HPL003_09715 [Paenibacillus terrae HPL-003]|uniref:Uncharacterized protein n=1 Tax=Paenibacillus terrae (strain HPL-003) TaxID=985665 RepID=G7W3U4_PAETH|nr:hypothetical protein HPL003_09715 [Paenibacillus terrae HPL-003]